MKYTIKQLAQIAGISTRTLRYYDQIGLLCPSRSGTGEYRIYSETEVDALHRILLYKNMGLELSQIKEEMEGKNANFLVTLQKHLYHLQQKKLELEAMIDHVNRTIEQEKGLIIMTDQEKFQAMKETLIKENETCYGEEIRRKYGGETVEASNQKIMNLNKEQYEEMQQIEKKLFQVLSQSVTTCADPCGEQGREAASLHKEWIQFTWPTYSRQAHLGVVEMYVADPRFTAYYDNYGAGCAMFLRDAVKAHI